MISVDEFKRGMRRLVSGVSLLTTLDGGERAGTIVTSVSSVSAEPPVLLVCLNRSNSCHDAVRGAGFFCINFLGHLSEGLSRRFAMPDKREQRFAAGEWSTMTTGAPVLADALASFDCRVLKIVDAHTHSIFLGSIERLQCRDDAAGPLLYGHGGFGAFVPDALRATHA